MEGNEDDDDVVRFASTLFYATEEQSEVQIAVLRAGEPSNACSVRCYTRDLSGQAGVRYGSVDETLEPVGRSRVRVGAVWSWATRVRSSLSLVVLAM